MLKFVIPKEKYSLCLVNAGKKDVQSVYLKYYGHLIEGSTYHDFMPTFLQTEVLFGESYAILEEFNKWNPNTTFYYEVLYVTEEAIKLKKFNRKNLDNVIPIESHPLFQSAIWEIDETSCEYINAEEIIQIVSKDIYAPKVPKNNSNYQYLLKRSELFEHFFEDLYKEMDSYYRGENRNSVAKWEFAELLQSNYGVQFEQSEGLDIILSSCVALMRKLQLSKVQMAEYFLEYII
ncbi:hypothetical protein [Lysinibacillus telephonicus]|uniref:Uncharacterized protein n=1 Tax=Lysinibacillus telephonicus TaxID=1714840 RepID=A0A3S0KM99_9BACI|nr:hypothetical protein [Lysinibacillus telephonicus]RTQ96284.1 hypothetical protein EKG35_01130 [Lysinibacillus telephonicus]